jgi:hypothetical protein
MHGADLYFHLLDRHADDPDVLRDFVLQSVWCLFAEDLHMITGQPVRRIVEGLLHDTTHTRSSAAELGHLFTVLNLDDRVKRGGIYAGAPYANGGLFARPARVHLDTDELELLARASGYDWRQVDPTIFGSLMEDCLGREHRWELGAHYTHESDIMRIIRPTIVWPWETRLEACETSADAEQVLTDLCQFRVLDPACGCGNFLYLAYRELRSLEARAKRLIEELAHRSGSTPPDPETLPGYPISNIHGIEIEEFAVLITRVTLWMGHKLGADRFGPVEPVLPLIDLRNIRRADALKEPWPEVDAIIGNPPFHGTKQLRSELGDEYADWLVKEFGIGIKDYCVYWFRKAHEQLQPGQRAGLVATNSIAEGRNREAALDYIAEHGGVITDAISSQSWPGEASVFVSIVNWIKEDTDRPAEFRLDGQRVAGITTSLMSGNQLPNPDELTANIGRQFFGVVPSGDGFVLEDPEAQALLQRTEASYGDVVRPYLIGEDINSSSELRPSRWIIAFGEQTLDQAMRYPGALDIVRNRVKPERDKHKKRREREALFDAVAPLTRFIACPATSRNLFMIWCDPAWIPGNAASVFAFEDDYSFGILTSSIHQRWAADKRVSTRFKGDSRYTTSSFMTFPWPSASPEVKVAVGALGKQVAETRRALCATYGIGLTKLYNQVMDGAHSELRTAHDELDRAVAGAYGWPPAAAEDAAECFRRLYELNHAIEAGEVPYDPFGAAPGTVIEPSLDL